MSAIYFLESDVPDANWAPFGGMTPLTELRAGGWRLRERWEIALRGKAAGRIGSMLFEHAMPSPPVVAPDTAAGPGWVVEPTFAPKLPMRPVGNARRLLHGGRTVAWRLDPGQRWRGPFGEGDGLVVEGRFLAGTFDLIAALEQFLFTDTVAALDDAARDPIPDGTLVFGNPGAVALRGAQLEPGVILDASRGAILLESGVQVKSGVRLEGPLWIREGSWIVGGELRQVSAGPHCRLRGELSNTVFNGYANKSHDGFMGHSVVGEWVNIGAGTITSNLKNTYGPIRLDLPGVRIETRRTNLGSLIGDHAKIAIGTLLSAGTVVGTGANVFGHTRPPKYVPPFAWGESDRLLDADGFVAMAQRIFPRRDVAVTGEVEVALRALHARGTRR